MNYETLYSVINLAVMPAWALLILAPGWVWTQRLVHSALVPLALAAVYLTFLTLGVGFGQSQPGAGMDSLGAVQALFSHPVGLLTGWVHFLVFDLFVGAWVARDARRIGLSRWFVTPSLLLTFLFGPVGLLIYLIARKLSGKAGWSLDEAAV
ncbi:ABA4-like family protein [Maricaulis sp.]|uniref:ABA4-like family protein n=1 Tax=Maricaulis sp. TaxID=1486257 RepID=UPI002B277515|nr:ABA4-like family protein [Maricaulis sp.]